MCVHKSCAGGQGTRSGQSILRETETDFCSVGKVNTLLLFPLSQHRISGDANGFYQEHLTREQKKPNVIVEVKSYL